MLGQQVAIRLWHVPRLRHGFFIDEEPPLRVLHLLALRIVFVVALDVQCVYVGVLDMLVQRFPPLIPWIAAVLAAH